MTPGVAYLLVYVTAIGLLVWLYGVLLEQARWLGASPRAYWIILGTLVIATTAPLIAAGFGAPTVVTTCLAVAPLAFIVGSLRWVVERTGGVRPEARLHSAFQRISKLNRGPAGAAKEPDVNRRLTAELDNLEQYRTPATAELIESIQRINRAWVAGETVEAPQLEAWKAELSSTAARVWGPGWRGRRE